MAQRRAPKDLPPEDHAPAEQPHDVLAAEEFGMGTPDPKLHHEPPHDILAAEEFGMGTPDPRLHTEPPHDVLAAEEFAVGDYDPALHHHGPVALPSDPTGIAEPHDVLAAEEFAMPAPRRAAPLSGTDRSRAAASGWDRRLMIIGGLALLVALRRRRGRR